MKIGKSVLNIIAYFIKKDVKKRRGSYPPHDFKDFLNIKYIDDNCTHHTYDVYLANQDNRKKCCVIDIHGGSYIFGEHQDNYPFGYELLTRGFDVVLMDYLPNNGKMDIHDLLTDLSKNFAHLAANLKEYDLENDDFVIAGDSAGGHLALMSAMLIGNKELQKELGLEFPSLNIKSVVLNCPTYDFENLGVGSMSSSGLKRMIGPRFNDKEHLRKYSCKTYINDFKLPIYLSTCNFDFIREESLKLMADIKDRKNVRIDDIATENKAVDHVHNVTKPFLEESKKVNDSLSEFIQQNR